MNLRNGLDPSATFQGMHYYKLWKFTTLNINHRPSLWGGETNVKSNTGHHGARVWLHISLSWVFSKKLPSPQGTLPSGLRFERGKAETI